MKINENGKSVFFRPVKGLIQFFDAADKWFPVAEDKYGTGIRTDSIPMLFMVTKSRSVMYSERWIFILASYASGESCVGR